MPPLRLPFNVGDKVRYVGVYWRRYIDKIGTVVRVASDGLYISFEDEFVVCISARNAEPTDEDQYQRELHAMKFL